MNFHNLYIWKFLTANTSNNKETSQSIKNANQVTDSRAVRGFAERNFQTNIPKKIMRKNNQLCSWDCKSWTISEYRHKTYLRKLRLWVNFKIYSIVFPYFFLRRHDNLGRKEFFILEKKKRFFKINFNFNKICNYYNDNKIIIIIVIIKVVKII